MRLRFIVDVDVDPISDAISDCIRDEIQSNLETVDALDFGIVSVHVFEDTTVAPLRETSQAAEFDHGDWDSYQPCTIRVHCPSCGGYGSKLGALGDLQWYRCRDCGVDFNRQTER